jgi:hypothetical protein
MTSQRIPGMFLLQLSMLCLLALPACAGPAETAAEPSTAPSSAATAPAATPTAATGTSIDAAGLALTLPDGWRPEAPSSGMRAAQATIDGSAGPGQLAVFFFGPGGGGGVDANIDRWISQMEMPAGAAAPARETFQAGGLQVTAIDLTGTLKASTIGSFPSTDQPGYRMIAAVVEGPGGPWFLRAVGPEATMAEQREAFLAMLRGARTG